MYILKFLGVLKVGYNLKMIAFILLEMKTEKHGQNQLNIAILWMPIWLKFMMGKLKHFWKIMLLNFQRPAGGWVPLIKLRYKCLDPINHLNDLKSDINNSFQEGQWVWTRNDNQVDYTKWDIGEPNNGGIIGIFGKGEDCLYISSGWKKGYPWNDLNCSQKTSGGRPIKPICQKSIM